MRIAKLSQKGFIGVLSQADLTPPRLYAKIKAALNQSYPAETIAIDGAVEIGKRIGRILDVPATA